MFVRARACVCRSLPLSLPLPARPWSVRALICVCQAKRKSSNVMMNTSFDPIGAADPPERWSIMMAGVIPTATDGAGASEDGGHGAGGEGGEGGEFVALTDPSAPPSSPGTQGSAASPPSPTSAPGSRSSSPTRSTQSPSITIVGKDGNAVVHREAPTPDRYTPLVYYRGVTCVVCCVLCTVASCAE